MALWFGYEWEIAISGNNDDGSRADIPHLLNRFDSLLVQHVTHVNNEGNGWWLESGAKYYRDASENGESHNEIASPECEHPDELLRHDIAAERLLLCLAELASDGGQWSDVRVSKANVCGASVVSWGSHENYEASHDIPEMPMLAWLASRILLTGAGGLDVTYPGIRFTLSPRAHFIEEAVNAATQSGRGLHNVGKASPYGTKHRVHVVAGDGNRAPLSTWLRFACTALAVRMMDTGRAPSIGLMDPVGALHDFALDPGLGISVLAAPGCPSGIVEIQRSFLEHALTSTEWFPEWAPRVLREWQRVLDTLSARDGWKGLVGQLDWPTKLALFEKVMARGGWTWERIREVNHLVEKTLRGIQGLEPEAHRARLDPASPIQHEVLRLAAEEHNPELIREFTALKRQLATVDARYMELGADSLFDHCAVPVAALADLTAEQPASPLDMPLPSSGRARVRAELVRQFGWKGGGPQPGRRDCRAHWTRFSANGRILAMPEVAEVADLTWIEVPESLESGAPDRDFHLRIAAATERLTEATLTADSAMDSGFYRLGANTLDHVCDDAMSPEIPNEHRISYWRSAARIYARLQRESTLPTPLRFLEDIDPVRLEWLWESCNSRCLLGLAGHPLVPQLAERVRSELQVNTQPRPSGLACWKSHLAIWHNRHGQPNAALRLLEPVLANGQYATTSEAVKIRIDAQIGELRRLRGEFVLAEEAFKKAYRRCGRDGQPARMLDYVMTGQARLAAEQGDPAQACRILEGSVRLEQERLGMPNLLRTMILLARLAPQRGGQLARANRRAVLAARAADFSGFTSCPLLAKVLAHWDAWCDGQPDPAPPADAEVSDSLWGV